MPQSPSRAGAEPARPGVRRCQATYPGILDAYEAVANWAKTHDGCCAGRRGRSHTTPSASKSLGSSTTSRGTNSQVAPLGPVRWSPYGSGRQTTLLREAAATATGWTVAGPLRRTPGQGCRQLRACSARSAPSCPLRTSRLRTDATSTSTKSGPASCWFRRRAQARAPSAPSLVRAVAERSRQRRSRSSRNIAVATSRNRLPPARLSARSRTSSSVGREASSTSLVRRYS